MITHLVKETRQQKEGRWLDKMWKKGGGGVRGRGGGGVGNGNIGEFCKIGG